MAKTLRFLLGDQLNHQHSWFQQTNGSFTYVLMEVRQETDYVKHHIQKVAAFFLAMRNFADWLQQEGHQVIYLRLDDPANLHSIPSNLKKLLSDGSFERFEYQLPDEHRLDQQMTDFCNSLTIFSEMVDSEHFLVEREFVGEFFKGKKKYLMESFYRAMRKKFDLLMEAGRPVGEKWNYDASNRKKFDRKTPVPVPTFIKKDVSELVGLLGRESIETIGRIDPKHFNWPTSRAEALKLLGFFNQHCLPHFGKYQDAMDTDYPFLFHSRLSFAMNVKLLSPLEVVKSSIAHWEAHPESISLAQIEGFVRQIIGWREYMRGIYWDKMPEYAEMNFFGHQRKLPNFFWTGGTRMNCIRHAVGQSLEFAYAHHIQRLMITGNFALLAGIQPDAVDEWYLGIYIDAIEWVEITNTRGMSQFADGGIVGTKPYVSSANYIDKMSNYCKDCHYDKKKKHGANACPFNSFYWHFYQRHEEKLQNNPRIGMAYRTWAKMDATEKEKIIAQAETYLSGIEEL